MLYLLLIILPFLISFIIGALGHGPLSHSWEAFLREGGPQYSVFEVKYMLVYLFLGKFQSVSKKLCRRRMKIHCLLFFRFQHEEMSCRIIQRIVDQDKTLQAELTEAGVDLDLVFALIRGHPTPATLVSVTVQNICHCTLLILLNRYL